MPLTKQIPTALGCDALHIWQRGVEAVDSIRLVREQFHVKSRQFQIAGQNWIPKSTSRICVVGAGKAGAGMAAGVEQALPAEWLLRTSGWVNVPADCVRGLEVIKLHGARPAGVNEPTAEGVAGTEEILRLVGNLKQEDLCIVLISGGGSALLPAPVAGVSLQQKLGITRTLMRGGATINELNRVRTLISRVKGGGLRRACTAGTIVTLIISDVIGDPLDVIASGPTIDRQPELPEVRSILTQYFRAAGDEIPAGLAEAMQNEIQARANRAHRADQVCSEHVIGNNRTAVEAATAAAVQRGYTVADSRFDEGGNAAEAGRSFARELMALGGSGGTSEGLCIVSGGETTVRLAKISGPQKGGRNQEFVLAAACELLPEDFLPQLAIVSGGTDGEDGPTDAAGALLESELVSRLKSGDANPMAALATNNSYPFWEQFGGLIKCGPTHTNVMDLRVGLIRPGRAPTR